MTAKYIKEAKQRAEVKQRAQISIYDESGHEIAYLRVFSNSRMVAVGRSRDILEGLELIEQGMAATKSRVSGRIASVKE